MCLSVVRIIGFDVTAYIVQVIETSTMPTSRGSEYDKDSQRTARPLFCPSFVKEVRQCLYLVGGQGRWTVALLSPMARTFPFP